MTRTSTGVRRTKHLARLGLGIAAAIVVVGSTAVPGVLAQTLPIQSAPPQTSPAQSTSAATAVTTSETSLPLTLQVTEGPYYKAGSPETNNLVQNAMQGTQIIITGQVLDQSGVPVANALLDFWQANANGAYDNIGYTLRGHQYTDVNGYYTLTTIVPGIYPGRTEHIHVKVQAPNSALMTSQLFFPGVSQNARDGIYDSSLLLNVTDNGDGTLSGAFNFVVATA
jgi:protocatechuate 3,4-dioxygenase beta subunit